MIIPLIKNGQHSRLTQKGLYLIFTFIILIVFLSVPLTKASDFSIPNEGDYITYRLTRKRLPDLITSSEFTVTFHRAPFTVQLDNDESYTILENETYFYIFKAELIAENWTLFFPEVKHNPAIYTWIIVTDPVDYNGFTGSSVYPVVDPFEEKTSLPFLLNTKGIANSSSPKEYLSGLLSNNIINFWIIENPGVHSTIYVEEDYGLLLYVIQEVHDPIFLTHDYSFELLECKLGDLIINEPINNMELLNTDPEPNPEPTPTGIPGFTSELSLLGILASIFLLQKLIKK